MSEPGYFLSYRQWFDYLAGKPIRLEAGVTLVIDEFFFDPITTPKQYPRDEHGNMIVGTHGGRTLLVYDDNPEKLEDELGAML